jgi:hypothetical protein
MKMEGEKYSYIRLDNATLVKLTFSKLAKNFAKYSKLMIDIKKLADKKNQKRKEFLEKLKNIEKSFKELGEQLPKPPKEKPIKKEAPKPQKVEVQGELETFEELREEFERLRKQLEEIKKG